jgi:hypothetical protein
MKIKFFLGFIGFILYILSFCVFSQTGLEACTQEGFVYKDHNIIFNNDGKTIQRVYLIHNLTRGIVMVNHVKADPGASAGWMTKMNPDNWLALAMNQPNFGFACMSYNPPQLRMVDCQSVIGVCSFKPKNNLGNYWLAQNENILDILKILAQRKIVE